MLDALHDWLTAWADGPAGPVALGVLSASEAVFFPLPPDPLLIALALAHPERALLYGALTTATSVAGGLIGHWIGLRFGRPVLKRYQRRSTERVERLFRAYGFWAVVVAGFTPLPFKLFTVSSGVFGMARVPFLLASAAGRAARFMLISLLIYLWGDRFRAFLDGRFELVMSAIGLLVVALLATWVVRTRRRATSDRGAEARGEPPERNDDVHGGGG